MQVFLVNMILHVENIIYKVQRLSHYGSTLQATGNGSALHPKG